GRVSPISDARHLLRAAKTSTLMLARRTKSMLSGPGGVQMAPTMKAKTAHVSSRSRICCRAWALCPTSNPADSVTTKSPTYSLKRNLYNVQMRGAGCGCDQHELE